MRMVRCCVLLAIAGSLLGCGASREGVPVSGAVKVKGQPLSDILVTFQPVGGGVGSTGTTGANGEYKLQFADDQQDGAAPGKHQVTFQDLLDKPAVDSDAGSTPPSKSRLPRAARSAVLEFTVPDGGTDAADFDLK
jgi:hypothetical protein